MGIFACHLDMGVAVTPLAMAGSCIQCSFPHAGPMSEPEATVAKG